MEREHVAERRSSLASLEHDDPAVILPELQLPLRQDHPGGLLAPQLAALEHEATREGGAGKGDGDCCPGAEVPGAADDLVRLGLPHVDDAELEPVCIRVLRRLENAADAEEPEVAALVGHTAVLDPGNHGRGHVDPVAQVRQWHVDSDVVAEPGERDAHG